MRRRPLPAVLVAGVLLLVLSLVAPATATGRTASAAASRGPTAASLVDLCYDRLGHPINTKKYAACRGFQAATAAVAAFCRIPGNSTGDSALAEDCRVADGHRVSERQVRRFRRSWVARALALQRGLDARAPLLEEQFAGTHNSFNASSYAVRRGRPVDYYPTLTNQDPNQVYSIRDQLRMGIRGLEVDLHWVPSKHGSARTHGYWVDTCHGQSTAISSTGQRVHVGCSVDRTLQSTLAEIHGWLRRHHSQFLLLYLENQLDGSAQGHRIAVRLLRSGLGHLVYRPRGHLPAGSCASMPYRASRARMMATGARVLLVGNCGPGDWNREVFTRGPKWDESGDSTHYDAAQCRADEQARADDTSFRRWYQESPFVEAATGASTRMTPAATRRIVDCGANLLGWDQLRPRDGRLRAFVWSWATGQPGRARGRHCAYQAAGGRFRAGRCAARRHVACEDRHLDWRVTTARVPWSRAEPACRAERLGRFGVPPNGYRNALLHRARPSRHARVWLDYRRIGGRWRVDP